MQSQQALLNVISRAGVPPPAPTVKPPPRIPPPPASPPTTRHYTLSEVELATFRTQLCENHQRTHCANPDACPHSHCLTWQRRNPYEIIYDPHLCPGIEFRRSNSKMSLIRHCTRGRSCTFAHSKEEELYHPLMYKTKICTVFPNCDRHYCPFAHSIDEIRHPYANPIIQSIWGPTDNSTSNGMYRWVGSPMSPLSNNVPDMSLQHQATPTAFLSPAQQLAAATPGSSAERTPQPMRVLDPALPSKRHPFTPKQQSKKNSGSAETGAGQSLLGQPSSPLRISRPGRERRARKKEDALQPNSDFQELLDSDTLRQALIMGLAQQLIGPQVSQLSVDQIIIVLDLAVKLAVSLQPTSQQDLHEQVTTATLPVVDSSSPSVASPGVFGGHPADDIFGDTTAPSDSSSTYRQALQDCEGYPTATQALIAQLRKLTLADSCDSQVAAASPMSLDEAETASLSILRGNSGGWSTSTSPLVGDFSSRSSALHTAKREDYLHGEVLPTQADSFSGTAGPQQNTRNCDDTGRPEHRICRGNYELADQIRARLAGVFPEAGCQSAADPEGGCTLPTKGTQPDWAPPRASTGVQMFALPPAAEATHKGSLDGGRRPTDDTFSPQTTTCSPSPFAGQVCSPQSRTAAATPAPPPAFPPSFSSLDNMKQAFHEIQQKVRAETQNTKHPANSLQKPGFDSARTAQPWI
ncbi:zinc ccch type domain protein [Cystoisospora suis]|uniref:Zinc ccch type domain protein n=1 Tax=Cystoisospora suis TaxID=483139 RepID=A0A2C6KNQ1_9APIC|nr:zinc ccch type domain protein [Cystoisospora suis]